MRSRPMQLFYVLLSMRVDSESRRRRGKCMKWKSLYFALPLSLSHSAGLYSWKVWRRLPNEGLAASRKEEGEGDTSDTALPGSSRPDRPTDRSRWSVDQIALQSSAVASVGRSSIGERRRSDFTSLKFLFNPLHVRRASTKRSIREGGI